jgi:hypothetical protein
MSTAGEQNRWRMFVRYLDCFSATVYSQFYGEASKVTEESYDEKYS